MNVGLNGFPPPPGIGTGYIVINDTKAFSTNGGSATSGAFRTRDLNTKLADTGNHATLANNQITLQAGTYRVNARCPAYRVNGHIARVQNITNGTTLVYGSNAWCNQNASVVSGSTALVTGRFTLPQTAVIELQHWPETSQATNGFGPANAFTSTPEVYASIELIRE